MCRSQLVWAVGLVLAAGCGSKPKLVDAEGTLKVAGQPVDKIHVEFWPEGNGPRSIGLTDAQGHFTLMADDGTTKGALPGKHRVVLRDVGIMQDKFLGRAGEDVDMTEGRTPRISKLYESAPNSPLTAEVAAGKPIELEAQPFEGGGRSVGRGSDR